MKTLPYHKNSFFRLLRLTMLLSLLIGTLGVAPAYAEKKAVLTEPQVDFLNPNGTLKVDGSYSGSIDLIDWDVKLDPAQGPVFAPAQAMLPPGWSALDSGAQIYNTINAVAIDGNKVYVGGAFQGQGGGLVAADYIAKWDGTNWSALGSNGIGEGSLNGKVNSIAVINHVVYVGGAFTNVNNNGVVLPEADYIAKWDGTNWSALGSNGAGDGSLNLPVYAMAAAGTSLYVAGGFTNVNNSGTELLEADRIAKWDGANWSALGSNGAGDGSIQGGIGAIAINGSDVYVGGSFTNVNNNGEILTAADKIAKWDGVNWSALGSNGMGDGALNSLSDPVTNSFISAIAVSNGNVYVGGGFMNVNNNGTVLSYAHNIARWDGANWFSLGSSSVGGKVFAISAYGNDVYVGGYFQGIVQNGVFINEADDVARWDGTSWHALGSNGLGDGVFTSPTGTPNGFVFAVAAGSNGVYVGGDFSNLTINGVKRYDAAYIAAYGKEPTFADVPASHPYYQDIEILYANGLTGGCSTSPMKFCPDQIMDRAQASVFMMRGAFGAGYAPNPSANLFMDNWTPGTWARPWAEAMRETTLTTGCQLSPTWLYCPWTKLPREQVVIFGLKMKYGNGYLPPAATGTVFADMTDPNYYATSWAEKAYADGLITNCGMLGGKPKFCPTTLVTRGLGAYVIVRAKNLTMP